VSVAQPTTVLVADGSRFALVGTQWQALQRMTDAPAGSLSTPGLVRIKVLGTCGFSLGDGRDASPGDVVEVDQGWAVELIRRNAAELATEPAA
jgi:hypothetical protein